MKHIFTTLFIFSLFTLQSHAATIQLPKTGQTTCYDASWSTIACSGTGQDGELQTGLAWPNPRFTDNGDQSVTDNLTGLIWTKDANLMKTRDQIVNVDNAGIPTNVQGATWQQALDYVKKLNTENYMGHNDWRLPNINELGSMVNNGQSNQSTWLSGHGFTSVQSNGFYWSATSSASNTVNAWGVDIRDGYMLSYVGKASSYYVWPVRSGQSGAFGSLPLPQTGQTTCYNATGSSIACNGTGQDGELLTGTAWPTPRFTDNSLSNGTEKTVTDNLTGLIWSKDCNLAAATKTWQQALDYVKTLNSVNFSGHNDWRLPNINELASIVSKGQSNPSTWLNEQGFTSVQSGNIYWSGSTVANSTYLAWYIDVYGGNLNSSSKNYNYYYVWPVRSGQSGAFDSLTLSIAKSGTGTGTVTSSTGGISCGTTCSASITTGTSVTLTATPASGCTFTGWTGACSGTGACTVTMDAAKSVTAAFALTATATNGTCGISNGATFSSIPATSFCTTGTASIPTGTGPWYWTCTGTNGGTTANCSAYKGSTPDSANTSRAKVYLALDDIFTAANNGLTVYGSSGNDTVTIAAGISGVTLDQNIERINLPGTASIYTFKQTGNKINVYDFAGTSLLVNVPVQGDSDGTVLGFSDGYASAKLAGGVMTLGGVTVSTSAPTTLSPTLQQ